MTIALPVSSSNADPVTLAAELELDPVVDDSLALHPPADARPGEEIRRPLLEHAGADARLDVLAAAALDQDGIDAFEVQELGEREAGRSRADDRDLRSRQEAPSSASTCEAIANAEFAAGTPQ